MDKISQLMDGELDAHQAGVQIARISKDEGLLRCWDTFHLVGDAMRGEHILPPDFAQKLSRRLAQEPTVLAPHRSTLGRAATYALSAAASLSAIAVVGWLAFVNNPLVPQAELARAPVPAARPAAPPPPAQLASVPNDGKLSEYLIAHQEFSPSTAIQGLAPYIRSVSSTQPTQER